MNVPKLRRLFQASLARALPQAETIDHLILDVKECSPRGSKKRNPATPTGQRDPELDTHRRHARAAAKAFAADEARKEMR